MSGEHWNIVPTGQWKYSILTVRDGHAIASVDVPLRGTFAAYNWLAFPSDIGDEAFTGAGFCVVSQLSKRMELPKKTLIAHFAEIVREFYHEGRPPFFDAWDITMGVTSRMV